MDRLTLSRRLNPDELDRRPKATLPPNPLPVWTTLPLDGKLPMMPAPKGAVKLFTTKVGEKIHKSVDFDLTDPYALIISNEYKELHDPHLKPYLTQPYMLHRLYKEGLITKSGKVLCNLKEFNEFRQYLRKIHLRMLAKERREKEKAGQKEGREKTADGFASTAHIEKLQAARKRIAERQRLERQRFRRILEQNSERQARKEEARKEMLSEAEQRRQVEETRRQHLMDKRRRKERIRRIVMYRRWLEQDRQREQRANQRRRQKESELQHKLQHDWEQRMRVQQHRIERESRKRERVERKAKAHQQEREQQIEAQRKRQAEKFDEMRQRHREKQARMQAVYDAKLQAKIARYWEQKKRNKQKDDMQTKKKKRPLLSTAHPLINESVSALGLDDMRGATVFSTVIGVAKKKSGQCIENRRSDLAIGDFRGVILSEDTIKKPKTTESTESMGYGDMHGLIMLSGYDKPVKESDHFTFSTLTKNLGHDIVQAAQYIVHSTIEIVSKIIFPAYQQVQVEKALDIVEKDYGNFLKVNESDLNQSVSDYAEDDDIVGVVENTALDGEMILKGVHPPKDTLHRLIDYDNDVLGMVENEADIFEPKPRRRSVRFSSVDEMFGDDSKVLPSFYELDDSGEDDYVEDEILFQRGNVAYSRPDSTDIDLQSVNGSPEDSNDEDFDVVGAPLSSKDSLTLAEKRIATEKNIASVYVKDALLSLMEDLHAGLLTPEQLLKIAECAREILDGKKPDHGTGRSKEDVSAMSSLTVFVDDYICGVIEKVEAEFEEGLIKPADIAASLIRLGLNTSETKDVDLRERGISSATSLKANAIVEEILEKVFREMANGKVEEQDIENLDDAIAEAALEDTVRSDTSVFAEQFTNDTIDRVERKLKGVQSTPSVASNASSVFAESFVNSKLNKVFRSITRKKSDINLALSPASSIVSAASSKASSLFAEEFVNSRIQTVLQDLKKQQSTTKSLSSIRSIKSGSSALAENIIRRALEELASDTSLAAMDNTEHSQQIESGGRLPLKGKGSSVSNISAVAQHLVQTVIQKVVGELRAGRRLDSQSVERVASNMMRWNASLTEVLDERKSSEHISLGTSKGNLPGLGMSSTSVLAETVIEDIFDRMLKEIDQDNLNNFEITHLAKSIDNMAVDLDWVEKFDNIEHQPIEEITIVPVIGQSTVDIKQEDLKSGLAALSVKHFKSSELKNEESLWTAARNSFRNIFRPSVVTIEGMSNSKSSQEKFKENVVQASCHNIGVRSKISRSFAPVSKSYNCPGTDIRDTFAPPAARRQSSEDLVAKHFPSAGINVVNIEHNADSLQRINISQPTNQSEKHPSEDLHGWKAMQKLNSPNHPEDVHVQPMVGHQPLDLDPDTVSAGLAALSIKKSSSPRDIADANPHLPLHRNSFRSVLNPDISQMDDIAQKHHSIQDLKRQIIDSSHAILCEDDNREPRVVQSGVSEDYVCDSGSQITIDNIKQPREVQLLRDQGRRSSLPEPSLLRQLQARSISKNEKKVETGSLTAVNQTRVDDLLDEATIRLAESQDCSEKHEKVDVPEIPQHPTSSTVDNPDQSQSTKRSRVKMKGAKSSTSAKKVLSSGSRSVPSTPPSHQSCPAMSSSQSVPSTSDARLHNRSKEKEFKEEENSQAKRFEKTKKSSRDAGKDKKESGASNTGGSSSIRSVKSPYAVSKSKSASPKNSASSFTGRTEPNCSSASNISSQSGASKHLDDTQTAVSSSSRPSPIPPQDRQSRDKVSSPLSSPQTSPKSSLQRVNSKVIGGGLKNSSSGVKQGRSLASKKSSSNNTAEDSKCSNELSK